jgi:predicted SprT family Zn-dependent metalloprotease
MNAPTLEQNTVYNGLFDYLNTALFNDMLPPAMLVASRNANVIGGYYAPDQWVNDDGEKIAEVALNANVMGSGDIPNLVQIVIHELCHHYQQHHGKPGRKGYHNKEWVKLAEEIGLEVTAHDNKSGGKTGCAVSTELKPGGRAETAILNMPESLYFPWLAGNMETPGEPGAEPKAQPAKNKSNRVKYSCPVCGVNAWAKPGVLIVCGDCERPLVGQD